MDNRLAFQRVNELYVYDAETDEELFVIEEITYHNLDIIDCGIRGTLEIGHVFYEMKTFFEITSGVFQGKNLKLILASTGHGVDSGQEFKVDIVIPRAKLREVSDYTHSLRKRTRFELIFAETMEIKNGLDQFANITVEHYPMEFLFRCDEV